MPFFKTYVVFVMLLCSINVFAQTQVATKIGTYRWQLNKKNNKAFKLNPKVIEKKIIVTKTPKLTKKPFVKQISFKKTIVYNGVIAPKKYKATFNKVGLKPNKVTMAQKFIFKDAAKENIIYTDYAHGFIADNAINITEDNLRQMWITTDLGLVKFNGTTYTLYTKNSGLPSLAFNSVFFDKINDKLWINTSEGVYYIKNDTCYIPTSSQFDFESFQGFHYTKADNNGNVWFTSRNKGAMCFTNNNVFYFLDTLCGLKTNYVDDIAFDKDNTCYIASMEKGFYQIKNNTIINYLIKAENAFNASAISFQIHNNKIYIGTWGNGLYVLSDTDSLQFSIQSKFNERIFDIIADRNHIYYASYGSGIVKYDTSKFVVFNKSNGLLNNGTYGLFADYNHNIWVPHLGAGISRINERVFTENTNNFGMNSVFTIKKGSNDVLNWYFNNGKALTYETKTNLVELSVKDDITDTKLTYVTDGYVVNSDELWCSTYISGVCHIKNSTAKFYLLSNVSDDNIIYGTKKATDNKIWFNTQQFGLVYYDLNSESFFRKSKENGAISNKCGFLSNYKNNILSVYDYGIQKIGGDSLYDLIINDSVFKAKITAVHVTNTNQIVLSTQNEGLYILQNNSVYQLTEKQGLLSNDIYNIIEDKNHKTWLLTSKGIDRIKLNGINYSYDRYFGNNYGSFINNSYGFTFLNDDGNFSFYSNVGLYNYEPENELKLAKRPIININSTHVNDSLTLPNKITISSDDKFSIKYNVINWGYENEFDDYYVLISKNNDTSIFKIGEKGVVDLLDMAPNKYKFLLKVTNSRKAYFSTPIVFEVMPYWYNRGPYRLLMFVLLCVMFYYFYKRKQNQNLVLEAKIDERTQELNTSFKEQIALTQEVHHRVKNNLQFIVAMLHLQTNTTTTTEGKEILNNVSRRINAMSVVHEMLYNKDRLEVVSLKKYLDELTNHLKENSFLDSNVNFELDLKIEDLKFNISDCVAIGMITSEIISNSVKYAFKNTPDPVIKIYLTKKTDNILFEISDNGSGFNLNNKNKTEGLGMRLISIFCNQLSASYSFKNENGLAYTFLLPMSLYHE